MDSMDKYINHANSGIFFLNVPISIPTIPKVGMEIFLGYPIVFGTVG